MNWAEFLKALAAKGFRVTIGETYPGGEITAIAVRGRIQIETEWHGISRKLEFAMINGDAITAQQLAGAVMA